MNERYSVKIQKPLIVFEHQQEFTRGTCRMTASDSRDVSLYYQSPSLDAMGVDYVVTLPTFRRPDQLIQTLESLSGQIFEERFCVVVMENDTENLQGARAAKTYLEDSLLTGAIVLAHKRGNCHAYNAGWHMAMETFAQCKAIAVIDDDELADPHWLHHLVETQKTTGAHCVGAPQIPVFENTAMHDLATHPVFAPPYSDTGPVPILFSSGNVLIQRAVLEAMPEPFLDPAFNFIGGGDSDFYSRARASGFTFAWCLQAPVFEDIPERRTTSAWMVARARREGAISALIEKRRRPGPAGHARTLAKSLAMLAAAPLRSLRLGLKSGSAATGLYYVHVATGRLLAEFGHINEQYRNPEIN